MLLFNSKALLLQWKPRDATENFDRPTYQNLQPHRAVLPAIAWHLVMKCLVTQIHTVLCCVFVLCYSLCHQLQAAYRDGTAELYRRSFMSMSWSVPRFYTVVYIYICTLQTWMWDMRCTFYNGLFVLSHLLTDWCWVCYLRRLRNATCVDFLPVVSDRELLCFNRQVAY